MTVFPKISAVDPWELSSGRKGPDMGAAGRRDLTWELQEEGTWHGSPAAGGRELTWEPSYRRKGPDMYYLLLVAVIKTPWQKQLMEGFMWLLAPAFLLTSFHDDVSQVLNLLLSSPRTVWCRVMGDETWASFRIQSTSATTHCEAAGSTVRADLGMWFRHGLNWSKIHCQASGRVTTQRKSLPAVLQESVLFPLPGHDLSRLVVGWQAHRKEWLLPLEKGYTVLLWELFLHGLRWKLFYPLSLLLPGFLPPLEPTLTSGPWGLCVC